MIRQADRRGLSLLIVVGAFVVTGVLPVVVPGSFLLFVLTLDFVFITLAISWNLVAGYAGLLNLGHAAFFGIGAYVTGLMTVAGYPPPAGILVGAGAAGLLALAMTPTFRLRTDYFAVATLTLPEVIRILVTQFGPVGAEGFRLPIPALFDIAPYFYAGLGITIGSILLTYRLLGTRFGYALKAIRENEEAAESSGVPTFRYKTRALLVSALIAGLVGGFYVTFVLFSIPRDAFGLRWTLIPVFMTLIGGRGTFLGPIIGALIFASLSQVLTFSLGGSEVNLLIFGGLIIAIAILMPRGIVATVASRMRRQFREF